MATKTRTRKTVKAIETHIPNLTERAMLVTLSITYWVTRRKDKSVADEVTTRKHAEKDAGAWWTAVIPASAMSNVQTARSRARQTHFEMTLPWANDGSRILPAAMFFDYTKKMREHEAEYTKAVEALLAEYPELVSQAKQRLGDMFKTDYYPPVNIIRTKFQWKVGIDPLPSAKDFRVDLGAEQTEMIKQDIEAHVKAAVNDAIFNLWERLYEVVGKMAEKMGDADSIFRDSIVGNITDLCNLLPAMNITKDPELDSMREKILSTLCKQKPEELRNNKVSRAKAKKDADGILKSMEAFMEGQKK